MSAPTDRKPILALQHIRCEPLAAYEDELLHRGLSLHHVHLAEGEPLPDWRGYSAIVAMGGPMGAYDDAIHPWVGPERRLIAEAVHAGNALLGSVPRGATARREPGCNRRYRSTSRGGSCASETHRRGG
jgi:hypothetical protein